MPDRQLLRDIRLVLRHRELRPVYAVDTDRRAVPNNLDLLSDFGVLSGRDNLGQAILMRLLTPRGELAALAHPEYGSRLSELIGNRNIATTQNLAKLYVIEALKAEPRIAKIVEVKVEPALGIRDRLNVSIAVEPIGDSAILRVGPFILELAP